MQIYVYIYTYCLMRGTASYVKSPSVCIMEIVFMCSCSSNLSCSRSGMKLTLSALRGAHMIFKLARDLVCILHIYL